MRAAFFFVMLFLIFTACVGKYQSNWSKPGLNMEDFRRAERECNMYADPVRYQAGAAYADNPFKESLMQDAWIRAFENCMYSKGYTKVN